MTFSARFLLLSLFCVSAICSALDLNAEATIKLKGYIFSAVTSKELPGAKVEILSQDSTVIGSTTAKSEWGSLNGNQYIIRETSWYGIDIPKVAARYTVKVSLEGYDTAYHPLDLTNLGPRQTEYEVENIYLRPAPKTVDLDELVVKASKVKFYHKGDTIVYNADAFLLPEGSMLDALVKQLPGVEIREGGAIYVNGRYVESLLLNGKDFFKGNNQVMLENLGAYLVKDIQVYEKGGHLSEMMGKNLVGDTEYVMDVKLKKDYMAGNLLNVKLSGGTKERYLGKLFGMHYTNNSRVAVYGNANNLNDTDKPNDGQGFELVRDTPNGLTDTYRGGIDYMADNPKHTWELSGNADVAYNKTTNHTDTYTTNFLPAGNTYDYSFLRPVSRNFGVSTFNSWRLKKELWELNVKPSFSYNHAKTTSDNVSASFNKEIPGITPDFIYNLTSGSTVLNLDGLINRNMLSDKSRSHGLDAGFFTEFSHKIVKNNDLASVWVDLKWNDYRNNRDNNQSILFGGSPVTATILNQQYKEIPNRNFTFNAGAKYYFNLANGTTGLFYNFTRKDEKKRSELFLLEARRDDGSLPEDFNDMEPVFDAANSYDSRQITNSHQLRPFYTGTVKFGNGQLHIKLSPEFSFYHRHLNYHRGALDVSPKKNDFTFRIMDTYLILMMPDQGIQGFLILKRTPTLASLVDMVDFRDTSDPLNIQEGNPHLRNSATDAIQFSFSCFKNEKWGYNIRMEYSLNENDLVRGYRYDSETGVRTFKTYNVKGNNTLNLGLLVDGPLPGVLKKIHINNLLTHTRYNYANMIGENRDPEKQRVRNAVTGDKLRIYVRESTWEIDINGGINYRHTRSEAEMFDSFNAYEFNYGIAGYVQLPAGFRFNTDLTMYSRRGYSQKSMNDNRLIWNANLFYITLKGALTFSVSGHDMLGQIKNISYDINARGRTETHVTTLPRYVTFSVAYKFDFKPKREK